MEQGEDYYEQQVFPLLAAMPQLCELEAGVGSTPYTCFSQVRRNCVCFLLCGGFACSFAS